MGNEVYIAKYPLFKSLNEKEVEEYKAYVRKRAELITKGFAVNASLSVIHPVCRKEMIKIIEESLREQGEL